MLTSQVSSFVTLSEYTASGINNLKNLPGFNLIDSSPTTLAGFPAQKIVYTYLGSSGTLKLMQVLAVKESKVYVLTYGTLENYYESSLPSIENMINSFEFTKSTSSDNIISSEILQPQSQDTSEIRTFEYLCRKNPNIVACPK
jgi:hypothetical protein